MLRLALISFHSCPVARLGEKDAGGMNVYVQEIARELGKRGNHVDVFTRSHNPEEPQIVHIGDRVRMVHLNAGPLICSKHDMYQYIPEFVNAVDAFRKREGLSYDLLHSHYWLSGRIGIELSRRWSAPHITTFHTLARVKQRARPGEQEPKQRAHIERMVSDKANTIVVSTSVEKEDLTKLYGTPTSKVRIIPPGVDLSMFQPMDKCEARQSLGLLDKHIILYVGRIEPFKGLDILLRALTLLDERSLTRLIIVGGNLDHDAELHRLKALASELGVSDMVSFTGSLPQKQLPAYYSAADVFALPTYYESFGLVALEAMACGTPVVVSRVGGLKTFIDHGETGYLVPWRCAEPFAHRLDTLLANPALRASMDNAAQRKAQTMSWGGVASRMLNCYSTTLGLALENIAGG